MSFVKSVRNSCFSDDDGGLQEAIPDRCLRNPVVVVQRAPLINEVVLADHSRDGILKGRLRWS